MSAPPDPPMSRWQTSCSADLYRHVTYHNSERTAHASISCVLYNTHNRSPRHAARAARRGRQPAAPQAQAYSEGPPDPPLDILAHVPYSAQNVRRCLSRVWVCYGPIGRPQHPRPIVLVTLIALGGSLTRQLLHSGSDTKYPTLPKIGGFRDAHVSMVHCPYPKLSGV